MDPPEEDQGEAARADIEGLDVGATEDGEPRAIDLSAGGGDASETLTDDLIFDEGDELDLSSDDAGMATAEISSQDTFVDDADVVVEGRLRDDGVVLVGPEEGYLSCGARGPGRMAAPERIIAAIGEQLERTRGGGSSPGRPSASRPAI